MLDRPGKIEFGPWGDRPIKRMIYWTLDYVVYLNHDLDLDFEIKNPIAPENAGELNRILNEAAVLETSISSDLDAENRTRCKELIGEVIACGIEGDFENANKMLSAATAFLQARRQEKSRIWYVTASGAIAAPILLFGICLALFNDKFQHVFGETMFWFIAYAGAGAVGALISIIVRSGALEFDPSSGKLLHWIEAGSKIFVGTISGIVVALAVKSGLFLTPILDDKNMNLILLVTAFTSGAGERFVTSIISEVNTLGITGNSATPQKQRTKAPAKKPPQAPATELVQSPIKKAARKRGSS